MTLRGATVARHTIVGLSMLLTLSTWGAYGQNGWAPTAADLSPLRGKRPIAFSWDSLGIGIQLPRTTASNPAEVHRAAKAGFRFARNDLDWEWVDDGKGHYDFSIYDREVELNARHGIRMVYILISHAFIANPNNPKWNLRTPEGIKRFSAFAAAAAGHFKGKGVIWEVWNEPDGNFWRPKPDADEFYSLLVEVTRAIRKADPSAIVIAPGAGQAIHPLTKEENTFLKTLLQRGMLEHVDGVSVHPYQAGGKPENAVAGYEKLREWIRQYAPKGKRTAIVCSEWGYEDYIKWRNIGYVRGRQARYVVRQFLVNLWQGVPLQIYFTWKASKSYGLLEDDGTPKPAFKAVNTVLKTLRGFQYIGRLPAKREDEYFLHFSDGKRHAVVVWLGVDAGAENAPLQTRPCALPLPAGRGVIISMFGKRTPVSWAEGGLKIMLSEEPQLVIYEEQRWTSSRKQD
ncbi:MAG TPA: hypothetical protein EYP85_14715 [Armatimonadetes bacterium]|nr:hypothetical protein [Armatimonadota bacterium]